LDDVGPRLSRLILFFAALGAGLHFAASIRARGLRRSVLFFGLGFGLPAAGELLATGPLRLLRHRLRYRVGGVPLGILLGWYAVIHGSFAVARLASERLGGGAKRKFVPPLAALVGVGLDLLLDPAGLDVGLWEWNYDGAYAGEVVGPNGHRGVPIVNYLGWISLVGGVTCVYELGSQNDGEEENVLPALLLLPLYLTGVGWALKRGKLRYLIYSSPFPVVLYTALQKG
jgi:uncharacterized membrane protein